jgi:hypothetical protein
MGMAHDRKIIDKGKVRETFSLMLLGQPQILWTVLGLNSGLHGEKVAIHCRLKVAMVLGS